MRISYAATRGLILNVQISGAFSVRVSHTATGEARSHFICVDVLFSGFRQSSRHDDGELATGRVCKGIVYLLFCSHKVKESQFARAWQVCQCVSREVNYLLAPFFQQAHLNPGAKLT